MTINCKECNDLGLSVLIPGNFFHGEVLVECPKCSYYKLQTKPIIKLSKFELIRNWLIYFCIITFMLFTGFKIFTYI